MRDESAHKRARATLHHLSQALPLTAISSFRPQPSPLIFLLSTTLSLICQLLLFSHRMCQATDTDSPPCPSKSSSAGLPPDSLLAHIVDAHCHPTDSPFSSSVMDALPLKHICAMATRASDQSLVRDLALAYPQKVIPCFGLWVWPVSLAVSRCSYLSFAWRTRLC